MKSRWQHTMTAKVFFLAVCLATHAALFAQPALGGDYPTKPISMIVAYGAGGGSDLAARTVAKYMEKYLGQAVVVENRSGAGGQIGFTALARAKSDGYTIGMLNVPSVNLIANLRQGCVFTTADLFPIGNVVVDPVVLAVGADSQFSTLREYLDYAKANPDKIILGVDGPQTNSALQPMIMDDALGLKVKYVFYAGAAPALTAVIGGHTAGTTPGASEALPYVHNKQLRVLAVFSEKRFPDLPDVPTFKEVAGQDIDYVVSNRGFGVPAGAPDAIKKTLAEALRKVVADPEFQAKAKEIGLPVFFESGEDFAKKMAAYNKVILKYKNILTMEN